VLNGINLSLSDGNLQVAGTDGHRLVHAIYSYPGNSGQVTIPLKVAESLSKLLGTNLKKLAQGNSTVVISQDYNRVWEISYEVNGAKVTYAFEEHSGTYPNYTQLFPNSFLSTVVFSGKDLKDSLSRIEKTVKRATISSVRFQFDSAIGKVAITADSHREEIAFDGDIDRGFSGKIAFNVYYLLDALKSDCFAIKDNGRVTLSFNSPTTPAILAPDFANSLNPATPVNSYRYLIMPVQIRDF
jgi:DNA polymerase III sliding clamp (beta) subunit (PCNA family)